MEFRKLFDILVHPNLHILISSYHHINLTERAKCKIYKYTNTKYLEDPTATCAIFLKSIGFKDIKYDIPVYQK